MGYLSQRKSRARLSLFLNFALLALTALILLPFVTGSSSYFNHVLSSYRFQYYIATSLMIAVCFYARSGFHMLIFTFLFLLNYFSVSSHANIFFNTDLKDTQTIKIAYFNDAEDLSSAVNAAQSFDADIVALNNIPPAGFSVNTTPYHYLQYNASTTILSRHTLDNHGIIPLSEHREASYVSYKVNNGNLIIINVDLKDLGFEEKNLVFKNLGDFILRQYSPVVVMGDFGFSAFTPTFKEFLVRTELGIKNRIIFKNWQNILNPPTINILGHSNSGVSDIVSLSQGSDSPASFLFTIEAY